MLFEIIFITILSLLLIEFIIINHSKSKIVGIYARCSTDETRQDIRNQLDCQIEWCKSHGHDYLVYIDYISGFKKPEGEKLKQLKNDVKSGKIQLISIYKLDRLTRKGISHGFNLIKFFKRYNVEIRSYSESFLNPDLPEEMKELILSVMLWASQLESKKTSDRIKTAYQLKKNLSETQGNEVEWGRKSGSYKIPIDLEKLKEFISGHPEAGYGLIANHFIYWNPKTRKQETPSRSTIKSRLEKLGVRKIIEEDSNGKKVSKWVFPKSTD